MRRTNNQDPTSLGFYAAAETGPAGRPFLIASNVYDFAPVEFLRLDPVERSPGMIGAAALTGNSELPDNYQPVESAWYVPGPTALIDVYAASPSTTGTLVVDDPNHIIAASDTPGDNDWFKVTLTAGETYQFGQYAYAGGIPGAEGNGVPLADAYLEIYDSAGNLLSVADGGGPNTPSGLDALMTFEAPYTGDYYVNATSYDNDGDGVGDFVGDYELFARTATTGVYTTPYDISSPLHSIDWGGVMVNRQHVSVRNPDGMEGPRPTGQPAADPADVEGNALGYPGKNVIYLYFAGQGDTYANVDSTIPAQVTAQDPYQYEVQAMLNAANEFSKVADVVFISNYTFNQTTRLYERIENIEYKPGPLGPQAGIQYATGVDGDGFDADFFYWSYPGTPGPGISLLGSMNPPDNGDEGVAQFNSADERWSAQMLQPGGFSFVTLIHEFGHGMGLAHPHDTGGGSSIMRGVEPETPTSVANYTRGDFDLNQGVHTMMSYEDGWETSPYGQAETNNEGYGWLGSLMALDIAAIQDKYGVNEEWATGNNTYVLKDVNEWGVYIDAATGQPAVHDATNQATTRDGYYQGQSTYYSSIWDAGGVDSIEYAGARDTSIDLRAATLQYEVGGAGRMSYATGIYGGFTIANGVTIENAFGGSGNDTITGNAANNLIGGRGGSDVLAGLGGNDVYLVTDIRARVVEAAGEGTDVVYSTVNYQLHAGQHVEALAANDAASTTGLMLVGNELRQDISGTAGNDVLIGKGGADLLIGKGGDDVYIVSDAASFTYEISGQGTDVVYATGNYQLYAGQHIEALAANDASSTTGIMLVGNELRQDISGTAGNDLLIGKGGADMLVGKGGNDVYIVSDVDSWAYELAGEGTDVVYASVNHALRAGHHIEALAANDGASTVGLSLTGNEFAQDMAGTAGSDTINGGGGADTLLGRGGADNFAFTTALGSGNVDRIYDFAAGSDKILLDDAVFAGVGGLGNLSAGAFVTGSAATTAGHRIIYDQASGALLFDADGSGAGAAIQFATVSAGLSLSASDFVVI